VLVFPKEAATLQPGDYVLATVTDFTQATLLGHISID
jgi:hypothetical protein